MEVESHTWWVGNPHRLENNCTTEALPLEWGLWAPYEASLPAWEPGNRSGNPQRVSEGQQGWAVGLLQDQEKRDPLLESSQSLMYTRIKGRWAVTPLKTEPYPPASLLILSMATWKKSCFPKAGPWISCQIKTWGINTWPKHKALK